jgi:hypothetical protein
MTVADEVRWMEEPVRFPWFRSTPLHVLDPSNPRGQFQIPGSERDAGTCEIKTIALENEYVKVIVIPELGGVIHRAIYKPTGDDFFFREDRIKDWIPYWESGVKVSFPFREHSVTTDNQPAAWRIHRRPDGTITLAMWMEFSRFCGFHERWIYGRFSNMLLSQHVTLSPGDATFTTTYRIVNPSAYRQGRRLWMDVILPREHTETGAVQKDDTPPTETLTEWIYPATRASGHSGRNPHDLRPDDLSLRKYKDTMSVFGWDMRYGFAGLWYPRALVNRLIVFDPAVSPGAKQWFDGEGDFYPDHFWSFKYNLVELWCGSDSIFEAVENWLGPGESYAFTHRYALVRGMSKTHFANDRAAIALRADTIPWTLEAVAFRPTAQLEAFAGSTLLGKAATAPDAPARFPLPSGWTNGPVALRVGNDTILATEFPLPLVRDTARIARVEEALRDTPERTEKNGDNGHFGEMFREAIGRYPSNSVARGRLLYRDGYVDAAIACLEAATATDGDNGEGWHLLGIALMEKGLTKDAKTALEHALNIAKPYPAANYYIALLAIREDARAEAESRLDSLLTACPTHWEGRLLRIALLLADPRRSEQAQTAACAAENDDPADPRLAWLLNELAQARKSPAAAERKAIFEALMLEPGAAERLKQFKAICRGEFTPPTRLGY